MSYEMKLMRRMLHNGLHVQRNDPHFMPAARAILDLLGIVPAILATTAAADNPIEVVPLELGGMAPPFPVCWLEGPGIDGSTWGNLVEYYREQPPDKAWTMRSSIVTADRHCEPTLAGIIITRLSEEDDWAAANCRFYSPYRDEDYIDPYPCPDFAPVHNALICNYMPALDLIERLNCRNIGLEPHDLDPAIRKRLAKRKTQPPRYQFHTLVLKTLTGRNLSPGTGQYTGTMPLHECKGSYAIYTASKPLFGRYTGKFWRPAHHKGNLANGIRLKHYAVA